MVLNPVRQLRRIVVGVGLSLVIGCVRAAQPVPAAPVSAVPVVTPQQTWSTDPSTPEYWEGRFVTATANRRKEMEKEKILAELSSSKHLGPTMVPMLNKQLAAEKSPRVKAAVVQLLGALKDRPPA
jgi:hypothetical protein